MTTAVAIERVANDAAEPSAKEKVLGNAANEFVFALVGGVGSGTTEVAKQLRLLLTQPQVSGGPFEAEIVKARDVIEEWARSNGKHVPEVREDVNTTIALQDLGDEMRATTPDHGAVAEGLARKIRSIRAEKTKQKPDGDRDPVNPDGAPRAYIVDSIKHPSEVELLRHIYQDAFVLIGVVCEERVRLARLTVKYGNAGQEAALKLMGRDSKGGKRHGQRVSDAFHMSDFFIDNSEPRTIDGRGNEDWRVGEHLSRLVKIVTHSEVVRPSISETAMHHAYSASLRSACLSRQVGAALVDMDGNVVATGSNEVPRAGGGVYGESFDEHAIDHRCAYSGKFCRNTNSQNNIVKSLIDSIPELKNADPARKAEIAKEIRGSGVGDLLEFSRAVHAEMDALLSAGRIGKSPVGCRLFVTTFPCHYCARHIVSSGVDEVQYIEPYPKSQALDLHEDSIQTSAANWFPPSEQDLPAGSPDKKKHAKKVLFRPFVGTAPRMYRRAFLKNRELKNKDSGQFEINDTEWGSAWHLRIEGYADLEAKLGPER